MLTNVVYDVIKKFVQLIIPGLSSLYFGLSSFWEFRNVEQVIGMMAFIAFFLDCV